MRVLILLLSVAIVVCVSMLQAETILVPSQYPTIQAGIDAAVDGDTVLVADGTYTGDGNRDIDFGGRAIVVMSKNGPDFTIIDCDAIYAFPHRGFYFHNDETAEAVVNGFTIKNGWASPFTPGGSPGGGMYLSYSSPTVSNCTFIGNSAYSSGGGMCITNGSPLVSNCRFIGNHAHGFDGGGMYNSDSNPVVTNCEFTENVAHPEGVGSYGGGMRNVRSNPTVTHCTFTENWAVYGAGMENGSSSPLVINCIFSKNSAEDWGGGMDNWAGSNPTVTHCTFSKNSAPDGGGICSYSNSSAIVTNCILWNDTPAEFGGIAPTVTYSCIQGGWTGEGNIDDDPVFVHSDKQDYRLLWDSPCIDTGDPTLFDPDGTRSDMGAHYFNQNDYLTLYITPDATEVLPGSQLGVTYTAINRWDSPKAFWLMSYILLDSGFDLTVLGPTRYTLPPNYTAQIHITHPVPNMMPIGMYYQSLIGMPPGTLYDSDSFKFRVGE